MDNPSDRKIMILGVGGTISSVETDQGLVPKLTPDHLLTSIPEISNYCKIECKEIMNTDSSNLQPSDWEIIIKEIITQINRSDIDGIVITHGTDTMSFTASATALLIRNMGKPVVFTGSQIPMPEFGSDAKRNLIDAIRVAASTEIAESVICFNSRVYRGCRTIKLREYDLSAFETVDPTPIAEIAKSVDILDPYVKKRTNSKAWYDGPLNPQVALLRIFPGMNPKIIKNIADMGYEGVVIEGFGAGNLPIKTNSLIPAIEYLAEKDIPVVITTQCVFGRTELLLYQTGRNFSDLGVISGHDMISEVALIKLMWALEKASDLDEITALMHTNLSGEINPMIQKK